jgi:hypothetical protein
LSHREVDAEPFRFGNGRANGRNLGVTAYDGDQVGFEKRLIFRGFSDEAIEGGLWNGLWSF